MRLSDLTNGESGEIVKVLGHGAFRKRMIEMGFVKGSRIDVLLHAPLKDPVKYRIMGYEVSLRRSEAKMIIVDKIESPKSDDLHHENNSSVAGLMEKPTHSDSLTEPQRVASAQSDRNTINVALIGNPNCGKTSLFNEVAGGREHVGNYSGVTVDAKYGSIDYNGYHINIVDLPGTYSLASYSPEELYVGNYLRDDTPDVIINVVAASNLRRNLYLTTELIDMDHRMVIALNMVDELEKRGDKLNYKMLGEMIGVPIVPTVSKSGKGIHKLLDTVIDVYEGRDKSVRHVHVKLSPEIEQGISSLRKELKQDLDLDKRFSPRFIAIKLLEGDKEIEKLISSSGNENVTKSILSLRDNEIKRIEKLLGEDVATAIAEQKYGFISGALAETLTETENYTDNSTRIIDAFVTNKLFGLPLFLLIMFFIFWATFYLGAYPMDWIQMGVDFLSQAVENNMSHGILKDMIADGIIGGVGGVIVFLPNILILYFCISFMEDSGYMARAAFIMDRLMHRIGLHGKSFIPLIMGFGCNVPAIISSRTIESPSSRIITILINPFMSCSARLPIYVLLVGCFFEQHAALVFMGLYLGGIIIAMLTAKLLRKVKFKEDVTPFVMELPPYRIPTLKASLLHTWSKGKQYLRKMGGVILLASIIVWALNYFPLHNEDSSTPAMEKTEQINLDQDSYLEIMGKAVNPAMEPIGMHWRGTVAAIAGVPAKEIVVSTLGVLYTGDEEATDATLQTGLEAPSPVTGEPDFTPASALAFMVFILLYCPCIATITAIVKETGSWKYGAFSVLYNTAVAWVAAFVVYRIALLF